MERPSCSCFSAFAQGSVSVTDWYTSSRVGGSFANSGSSPLGAFHFCSKRNPHSQIMLQLQTYVRTANMDERIKESAGRTCAYIRVMHKCKHAPWSFWQPCEMQCEAGQAGNAREQLHCTGTSAGTGGEEVGSPLCMRCAFSASSASCCFAAATAGSRADTLGMLPRAGSAAGASKKVSLAFSGSWGLSLHTSAHHHCASARGRLHLCRKRPKH